MMDLAIGAAIRRRELHARYGGNRQSGISHSRTAPVVMCFTDAASDSLYGYRDGWGKDGLFHYTGEGQVGDQRMTNGNRAILNHLTDGRELHLFEMVRTGVVEYRGQFEIAGEPGWYRAESRDRNGDVRSVIVFTMRPLPHTSEEQEQTPTATIEHTPSSTTSVWDIPPENSLSTRVLQSPSQKPTEAVRRESQLLSTYTEYLERQGHRVSRKRILPRGERSSLYTDLFDSTDNLLIEAKGQATRESIRMAIGQLLDYQRYIEPRPRLAILVPTRPREDLRDLCASLAIHTIWPSEQSSEYQVEPVAVSSE
ncbi:restriction endonuclease [Streptomyces spectabilis]|uniref:restriction endonuclease n=1 Tax=Streptomyces spectabilis TaxID=68270 RepID=UPI0033C3D9B9